MSIKINENYDSLVQNYLFREVAKRVDSYISTHPNHKIIRLGIGDVTLPLTPTVIKAMHEATDEMASQSTFKGYCSEFGYDFARKAVADYYGSFGVKVAMEDCFVSDGAKSDVGNIVDIFGDNEILIPDPVYPVYQDSNIMSGRKISYIKASKENGFLPMPDELEKKSMIIYLCSPNNPTGAVYNREQLKKWVDFALESGSVIIFDSAYEAYIHGDYPRSIYDIENAEKCCIEVCSLSKTAGFTGTRFSWTVVPSALVIDGHSIRGMWARRQATKFNGVPYVIQKAGEAALSAQGIKECRELVAYYMENARMISNVLTEKGIWFTGGVDSPYIWLKCPNDMDSWTFFDYLLNELEIVGTPGAGFGAQGEGYFRLTSFGSHEATAAAVERIKERL